MRKVFVQASPGSFNHKAIENLKRSNVPDFTFKFTKKQADTMEASVTSTTTDCSCFFAVGNPRVDGYFVPSTLKALTHFKIIDLQYAVLQRIEMCVIRKAGYVGKKFRFIYSKKDAVEPQIFKWLKNKKLIYDFKFEDVEEGTSVAAEMLSEGKIPDSSVVIGPDIAVKEFLNLEIEETSIQDARGDNYTLFFMCRVRKRSKEEKVERVKKELDEVLVSRIKDFDVRGKESYYFNILDGVDFRRLVLK